MGAGSRHEQMRETWGRVASGWGARSKVGDRNQATTTEWLLTRADPQPGEVVLDLAGGAGGLGRLAAELVGPDGSVLATDFAPEMVDVARQLGEASGHANLDYHQLDAQQMDLTDSSVDVVLCRSGLMLMVEPDAAVREVRRVLRPGGRFACSVFTTPEENPWATTSVLPFLQRGLVAPPEPGGPGMFALGDRARLYSLIAGAGFEQVEVETVDYVHEFVDDDAIWSQVADINAHLSQLVKGMDPAERNAMRTVVIDAHKPWQSENGSYQLPGRVLAAIAN